MDSLLLATALLTVSGVGETVLLDFTASWCGPCQQLAPVVEELAEAGYPVRKVDIDQHPELAAQYNVTKVPTLILVKDGQPVSRGMGILSRAELEGMMRKHGVSPAGAETTAVRGQSPPAAKGGLFGLGLLGGGSSAPAQTASHTGRSQYRAGTPAIESQKKANGPAPRWNPTPATTASPRQDRPATASPAATEPLRQRTPPAEHLTRNEDRTPRRLNSLPARGSSQPKLQPLRPRTSTPRRAAEPASFASGDNSNWQSRVAVTREPTGLRRSETQRQLEERLLAASVRLRIEEGNGQSIGSGTFIDSRDGQSLILTCGHIFRDSKGQGRITVDTFERGSRRELTGRLVHYDLVRDIGLVSVRTGRTVETAELAVAGHVTKTGDSVLSIGCDGGRPPAAHWSRVMAVDAIVGPPNLQVSGQPEVGRSGGGLFDAQGRVIGVCNLGDPTDRAGLFAALATVHDAVDQAGLTALLRQRPTPSSEATQLASNPPVMPTRMPKGRDLAATLPPVAAAAGTNIFGGKEVICIVRSSDGGSQRSELIVIKNASPDLISQLAAARRVGQAQFETSLDVASPLPQASPEPTRSSSLEWRSPQR